MSTTTSTAQLETVQSIYAAFGRGDVPHILDQLDDDVSWDEGIRPTAVPWLQPGRGKDHVLAFFGAVGQGIQFSTFELEAIAVSGDVVIAIVREEGTNLASGRPMEQDLFVHYWTFGPSGKVVKFRHIGDWARHEASMG